MIVWTDYLRYRAALRGFDLDDIESIVRYSDERYMDTLTLRRVAIGRSQGQLLMVPYDHEGETWKPVTVHATTRQQINTRLQSGRFRHE